MNSYSEEVIQTYTHSILFHNVNHGTRQRNWINPTTDPFAFKKTTYLLKQVRRSLVNGLDLEGSAHK